MGRQTVNVELRAGGGSQVAGELGKVSGAIADVRKGISILASSLGGLGGKITQLLGGIFTGGVWEIGARAISGAISLWNKWSDSATEAEEAVSKAEQEAHDARLKHLSDFADKVAKVDAARKATINENLKRINDEIDATKDLTKATLELARADARRRGDKAAVARLDDALGRVGADASRKRLENEIDAAKKTITANKQKMADLSPAVAAAASGIKIEQTGIDQAIARVREEAAKNATGKAYSAGPGIITYMAATDEDRKAAADAAEARFRESEGYAELAKKLDEARGKQREMVAKYSGAEKEVKEAESKLAVLEKRAKALDISEQAKAENREQDAREKEAEEVKKFNAEKARLEKQIADERKRLDREVAAEREKRERELHQKRMEDLREEMAAQKSAASVLTSRSAAAQSEFDRAFAMFRDPSRAAAEIGEEKAYQSDLDRLHKTARQYGGKWRIDELSRLMAAGDTQGVTDTLNTWRKTKGFTPEVEAMVRASAAEKTKTTAEDELRKVNDKVASMSDVLKQMADAQSGKLGTIADSTSGLAEKIDQLLKVKG